MVRITYVGAAFLSIVAIVPTMVYGSLGSAVLDRRFLRRNGAAYRSERGI